MRQTLSLRWILMAFFSVNLVYGVLSIHTVLYWYYNIKPSCLLKLRLGLRLSICLSGFYLKN